MGFIKKVFKLKTPSNSTNSLNKRKKSFSKVNAKFDAGTNNPASSSTFENAVSDVNSDISWSLSDVQSRSRGKYINSYLSARNVDVWVAEEIGAMATIKSEVGVKDIDKMLSALWKSHQPYIDYESVSDFHAFITTCVRERRVCGEVFIRLVRSKTESSNINMQLQMIPCEMIPSEYSKKISKHRKIESSIEYNKGKKVAIWVKACAEDLDPTVRIPFDNICHSFIQKFPGQTRGLPASMSSLLTEGNLSIYAENEIDRKSTASSLKGVMINKNEDYDDDDDDDFYEDEASESSKPEVENIKVGKGAHLQVLPRGYEVEFNNNELGQNYVPFMSHGEKTVCMGHGVPYSIATGDFNGISDRTLRTVTNQFRRQVGSEKKEAVEHKIIAKVWRWFIDAVVLSGVKLPDFHINPYTYYNGHKFITQAFAYDHPVQDMQAIKKAIEIGISSPEQVARERNINFDEINQENKQKNRES